MNKTLRIANFVITHFNQHQQPITFNQLGNLLYLIAGNYYLKYHQLLFDEPFYRLGVGYQLPTVKTNFKQVPKISLKPTSDVFKLSTRQQNFIIKQLTEYNKQSYNQLAYQCSLLKRKLMQSKLDLTKFENNKKA